MNIPNPKYKVGDIIIYKKYLKEGVTRMDKVEWGNYYFNKEGKEDGWHYSTHCLGEMLLVPEKDIIKKLN